MAEAISPDKLSESRKKSLFSKQFQNEHSSSIPDLLRTSFRYLIALPTRLYLLNPYIVTGIFLLFTGSILYSNRQAAREAAESLENFANQVRQHFEQELYSIELIKNVPQDETTTKLLVPDIINIYPDFACETHHVTTSDGYILELHRIVPTRPVNEDATKLPVILQHGLLADSSNWVLNGGDRNSLGFALAERGYDVWLGNSRGNTYSRRHQTLDASKDSAFWDFSWFEMATIDIPTVVDYVLEQTESKQVHYVGHSQGTLIMFVALHQSPQLRQKIHRFHALAPIAFLTHMKSPLVYLAKSLFAPRIIYHKWPQEILPLNEVGVWLSEKIGSVVAGQQVPNPLVTIVGFHPKRYILNRMSTYLAHWASGTSMQNLLHFAQMIRRGVIEAFSDDRDCDNNSDKCPEEITLDHITGTNITLYCGIDDMFSDMEDVTKLETILKEPSRHNNVTRKNIEDFDHLSFLWGNTAYQDVYLGIMKEIEDG